MMNKIDEWQAYLRYQKRYSEYTLLAYLYDVEDFFSFYRKLHHMMKDSIVDLEMLAEIDLDTFRHWLAARLDRGVSARSNARAVSALKSYFHYLIKRKYLPHSDALLLQKPKLSKLLPKPVKQEVLDVLFKHIANQKAPEWVKARDDALYSLLYATGLRIHEALRIRVRDVSEELHICGKGGRQRMVPLLKSILKKIYFYIYSMPFSLRSEDYIFRGQRGGVLRRDAVEAQMKRWREKDAALPEHLSPHALRHSFATHMVQAGADLKSVQELLGHASISTVEIYTDVDNQEILKVYQHTHPFSSELKRRK